MTLSTTSHRAQDPTPTTTERHREEQSMRQPPDPARTMIEPLDDPDNTLQARYGFWIQTLRNHPIGVQGVYLSTFQKGRGQHITALDTGQARKLGERLIALADDIEAESA